MSLFGYNCGPSFPVSPSNRIVWGVPDSDSEPKVTPIKKPSTKKRPFVFSPETETVSRPARPTGVIFGEEDANADSGDEEARVKANGNFLFGSVPRKPGFDPAQFSFGVASIAEANAKAEAKKWCGGGNCKKRVGLLGFKCRCKKIFCGKHRYPEEHGCTFDHVAFGRQIIQKQNPLIETDKLENRI
ncbi:Zinc finger AN1 domain-containing stress-associated protein 14 [Linum grandiflorum]